MYASFYHLTAEPFRLSPDPGFCFQHQCYRKAMIYMLHALHRAEGFIMIAGRPGTGKTTLINDLVQRLKPDQVAVAKIVSTQLSANDLLDLVAHSFNIDTTDCTKARVLIQIERFLNLQHKNGRRALLIVDEAQDMGREALEELRLLTNIQLGNFQLLQVFLVGQEELRATVTAPSLEQLHQRLIAATHLEPLDSDSTMAYIKHRLRCANWHGDPLISTQAYGLIQQFSHGIPRRINHICNRLLLHGCIEEKHRLGIADLKVVIAELEQELLLPVDTENDSKASQWPDEQQTETYEAEPQPTPPVLEDVVETIPEAMPDTPNADQQSHTTMAHTELRTPATESRDVGSPSPAAANNHEPEDPDDGTAARRARSRRFIGVLALIACLVIALLYATRLQSQRLPDRKPQASGNFDRPMASGVTTEILSHRITAADKDRRTGLVVRASSGRDGEKLDTPGNELTIHPPAQNDSENEVLRLPPGTTAKGPAN